MRVTAWAWLSCNKVMLVECLCDHAGYRLGMVELQRPFWCAHFYNQESYRLGMVELQLIPFRRQRLHSRSYRLGMVELQRQRNLHGKAYLH